MAYEVNRLLWAEGVLLERPFALDDSNWLPREEPQIALLGTDAAVAGHGRFNLGGLDLEDEGTAMAVAAIAPFLCFGHWDDKATSQNKKVICFVDCKCNFRYTRGVLERKRERERTDGNQFDVSYEGFVRTTHGKETRCPLAA